MLGCGNVWCRIPGCGCGSRFTRWPGSTGGNGGHVPPKLNVKIGACGAESFLLTPLEFSHSLVLVRPINCSRVQGSAMRKNHAGKSALMALVKRKLPLPSNWLAATGVHWEIGKALFVDAMR